MDNQTAEQQARDMLERMGIENAQSFTSGDLVELANLIAQNDGWKLAAKNTVRRIAVFFGRWLDTTPQTD